MKALILSAGYGTRLGAITKYMPKSLVPVLNTPVIEYAIRFLKYYGVHDFFINLHHLPDKVVDVLGNGSTLDVSITYLHEEDEILGTGGAIGRLRGSVNETLVVVNADTIFDFNFDDMLDAHMTGKHLVTLGLVHASPETDPRAVVTVDEKGQISMMRGHSFYAPAPKGNAIFTGIHILDPKIFEYIPSDICTSISADIYVPMIENREYLHGYFIEGKWWEVGTPEALFATNFSLLDALPLSYFNPLKKLALNPDELESGNLVAMGRNDNLPTVPIYPPVMLGNNVRFGKVRNLGPQLIAGDRAEIKKGYNTAQALYFAGADGKRAIQVTDKGVIYY